MGDNGVYDLGVLELRLADVDLNLRLSSEIKIAPSPEWSETDRDDIRTLGATGNPFRGDGVRRPWLVKSHGYQLKVDFALAPGLKFEDETYTQQVAAKLKHLEIWQSLGFQVTSIETCSSDNAASSWTLSLDYRESTKATEIVRPHALAPDLPYYDARPPPGIHVMKVEVIQLNMLLRKPPASGSLTIDPGKYASHMSTEGEDMCFNPKVLFNTSNLVQEGQLSFNTKVTVGAGNSLSSAAIMTEKEANMHVVPESCAYMTPPPSQETKEQSREGLTMGLVQSLVSHVSSETLLSCIEAGLRHAMHKLPTRKSKTDIIISNEDFDSLPEVAPALWMPGYHKSVSERAVFLATISHAIANVSRNASTHLGIKIKTWQLSHRYPHHGGGGGSSADLSSRENGLQEALSVSLWTTLSSALSSTRTVKQPRLFWDSSGYGDEMKVFGGTGDMLDEIPHNGKSDQTSDESEFEDLLGMSNETDNESMSDWSVGDRGILDGPCCTEVSEHRLPNRWNTEPSSLLDPEFDMFDYGPELRGDSPDSVVRPAGGGCHDVGQCSNGSDRDPDSAALQHLEMESEEFNDAEDMLLQHVEALGGESSNGLEYASSEDRGGLDEDEYEEDLLGLL